MAMATMSQSVPGLQVTAPDDDMEISSDFGRVDDDIEIDLDLGGSPSRDQEDDYMLEDARSEVGQDSHQRVDASNKDDIMVDEDGDIPEDGIMQDDLTIPDEHLTDASEIGQEDLTLPENFNQHLIDNPDIAISVISDNPQRNYPPDQGLATQQDFNDGFNQPETDDQYNFSLEPAAPVGVDELQTSGDIQTPRADTSTEHQAEDHHEDQEQPSAGSPTQQSTDPSKSPVDGPLTSAEDHVERACKNEPVEEESAGINAAADSDGHTSPGEDQDPSTHTLDHVVEQVDSDQQVKNTERTQETSASQDGHHDDVEQYHSGYLHPVIVMYEGDEISLFPPNEQENSGMFFLQDESLAYASIWDLLQACRQVLGETIRDEDELNMDITDFGLSISEDSTHASTTSFSQILDIYVQLHQHDGIQSPPPLYVTLNTKTRFSSRLKQLAEAAFEGKGISQLTVDGESDDDGAHVTGDEAEPQDDPETAAPGIEAPEIEQPKHTPTEPDHGETDLNNLREDEASHSAFTKSKSLEEHHIGGNDTIALPTLNNGSEMEPKVPEVPENPVIPAENDAEGNIQQEDVQAEQPGIPGEDDLIDYDDDSDVDEPDNGASSYSSTIQGDAPGSRHQSIGIQGDDGRNYAGETSSNQKPVSLPNDTADAATLDNESNDTRSHPSHLRYGELAESREDDRYQVEYPHFDNNEPYDHNNGRQSLDNGDLTGLTAEFSYEQYDYGQSFDLSGDATNVGLNGDDHVLPEDVESSFVDVGAEDETGYDDFKYADFEEDSLSGPGVEESAHAGLDAEAHQNELDNDGFDAIDYNDEGPPSPPESGSQVESYHPTGSPPNKRCWTEDEDGAEADSSSHDVKRVKSS